jgi:hypothetical protein
VKVILGDAASLQTDVVPIIVAVGNGLTVIIELPVCAWLQDVTLASLTLTSEYVNIPATLVGAATVTLLPAVVVIV